MNVSRSLAACAPQRYGSLSSPRQSCVLSGASMPHKRMRALCISNVSPSITLACPIMSSAKVPFEAVIKVRNAINPSHRAPAAVPVLTAEQSNAAVRLLRCVRVFFGVGLQNIVDRVVRSYGAEVSGPTQEKLINYIQLLASTGIPDEKLLRFGRAYLKEILKPNPRYTGC
jgi:hypothetical protein